MLNDHHSDAHSPAKRRRLKWAFSALSAVLAVILLLYVSAAAGLDSPALKSRLEAGIATWSGLSVNTTGMVTIGFFPLKATLYDVSVTDSAGPVSVDSKTVEVRFPVL